MYPWVPTEQEAEELWFSDGVLIPLLFHLSLRDVDTDIKVGLSLSVNPLTAPQTHPGACLNLLDSSKYNQVNTEDWSSQAGEKEAWADSDGARL